MTARDATDTHRRLLDDAIEVGTGPAAVKDAPGPAVTSPVRVEAVQELTGVEMDKTRVVVPEVPTEPPAGARHRYPVLALRELWDAREVILSLTERDVRSRYKQATLGAAWAVINPIVMMLAFVFFVQAIADIDTGGEPYALFAYLGLLPWTFFTSSLTNGGVSLLTNTPLLNKVRCPREVFPLSSIGVASFDTVIMVGTFVGLLVITTTMPEPTSFWVLPLLLIQYAFTTAVVLLVSILVVYFRDVRHMLGPIQQFGIFATPVAYSVTAIDESIRPIYAALNPLAAVIDGYRRAVLYGTAPDWAMTVPAAISAAVLLVGAFALFKRMEVGIADIA
jgi:ABC-type polysaccharide/polyol phosphate export permease